MAATRLDRVDSGRDDAGRFARGNPGGPGRPRRATEQRYLEAMSDACPPEAWAEIVGKAVQDARTGDAVARAWLASYLVGKADATAPTLLDGAMMAEVGADPVDVALALRRLPV